MPRMIDAEALRSVIANGDMHGDEDQFYAIMNDIAQVVDAAPTIDPVRHGRWARDDTFRDLYFCDQCLAGEYRKPKFKYCPDCGARMDGGEGDASGTDHA